MCALCPARPFFVVFLIFLSYVLQLHVTFWEYLSKLYLGFLYI